jgi:ferric-dicitrate binding protein FerR (iron transport regulator)
MAMIAAAATLVMAIAGAWWFTQSKAVPVSGIVQQPHPAIVPGGDKAMLTLADGTTIVLDSSQNGLLLQQGNVKVIKAGGQLAYDKDHNPPGKTGEITYNTLSTPRGGQYLLQLEDGSKVWLNAASSIRYPTFFGNKERVVELTGEAYLEIAKNPTRPFRVMVRGMQVEVLGTRFNINAYGDEQTINTTLLEGSVKLSLPGKASNILKPGQQAQLNTAGIINIVEGVDLEEVVAWKEGLFQFNRAGLHTVMRQIARWYNIDIVFEGNLPTRYFGGKISRNSNITEVLRVLQLSKIKVTIEGRKLTVSP